MLDEKAFDELVAEIMGQGFDEETAVDYAVLIGDTPIMDEHRNVEVRNERGHVLARLKPLKCFAAG